MPSVPADKLSTKPVLDPIPAEARIPGLLPASVQPDVNLRNPMFTQESMAGWLQPFIGFTPTQRLRLLALQSPIAQRDYDDTLTGVQTLTEAAAWLSDDRVLLFNQSQFILTEDVFFSGGVVRGNGSAIQPAGFALEVQSTFFDDLSLQGGTLRVRPDAYFANAKSFATTIDFGSAGTRLVLRDVKAGGVTTVLSTSPSAVIVLQNSTEWPMGLTLPTGVTLDDQRGGFGGATRDPYALATNPTEKARIIALFTSPGQTSALDTAYTATNAPFGSVVYDFVNGDRYELFPNPDDTVVIDSVELQKPYWGRV